MSPAARSRRVEMQLRLRCHSSPSPGDLLSPVISGEAAETKRTKQPRISATYLLRRRFRDKGPGEGEGKGSVDTLDVIDLSHVQFIKPRFLL